MRAILRGAAGALLLAGLVGCGNYTIVFEMQDVINAPGDDLSRDQLDVDIVALDGKNADRYPELANLSVRSKQWFQIRDSDDPKYNNIPKEQIYALRRGGAGDKRDTLVGEPLVSGRDMPAGGTRTVSVNVKHPDGWKGRFLIFGRFSDGRGVAAVEPTSIASGAKEIYVQVGRKSMQWIQK
ncbi:MAG: hypothetical protein U1D55_16695 [Phycisphaerae bacterium]